METGNLFTEEGAGFADIDDEKKRGQKKEYRVLTRAESTALLTYMLIMVK